MNILVFVNTLNGTSYENIWEVPENTLLETAEFEYTFDTQLLMLHSPLRSLFGRFWGIKFFSMEGINLECTDLEGANLVGFNLKGANLKNCNLKDVDFSSADLDNANFKGSNLTGAKFNSSFLESSNFEKTNLFLADFQGAVLKNVNFEGAHMAQCNLKETNWEGANFKDTYISKDNFEGITLDKDHVEVKINKMTDLQKAKWRVFYELYPPGSPVLYFSYDKVNRENTTGYLEATITSRPYLDVNSNKEKIEIKLKDIVQYKEVNLEDIIPDNRHLTKLIKP